MHSEQTDYEEGETLSEDLCNLLSGPCATRPIEEVPALRERYGADIMTLLVDQERVTGGIGTLGPSASRRAGNVVEIESETVGHLTVLHEIGHNLGARHNPGWRFGKITVPYGHGRCNPEEGWHTVMAYATTERNGQPCYTPLALLSGPDIMGPYGTPTGDAETHDVARLVTENTPIVAKYRAHRGEDAGTTTTHLVPYLPGPNAVNGTHAFVRVINYSARGARATITITEDNGEEHATWLDIEQGTNMHFTRSHLERGDERGLGPGVGPIEGASRMTVESDLDLSVLAYARAADGSVSALHQRAPQWTHANGTGALLEFFNPGSNAKSVSIARVINLESRPLEVQIRGTDDLWERSRYSELARRPVRITLEARQARNVTSAALEKLSSTHINSLGNGTGRWILAIHADGAMEAMSLLVNEAGYITNVSQ